MGNKGTNIKMKVHIKKGDIIQGHLWNEPVEVEFVEDIEEYIRIIGITTRSHSSVNQLIPITDIPKFSFIGPKFSEEPWKVFLSLENT